MSRYLSLSRAARLVGITRGELQKKIRAGGMTTFEGEVEVDELLRAYPQTQMEDNTMLERVERIMENALTKMVRVRALPDAETLAARVSSLSRELAEARAEADAYRQLIERLEGRLAGLMEPLQGSEAGPAALLAGELSDWLRQALEERTNSPESHVLMAREAFLRVMAAHVSLWPSGHDFFVDGADSLLEAALHGGLSVSYGCSDGSCGLCRARVASGRARQIYPHSYPLSESEQASGVVLMCCHTAVSDLVLEVPEAAGPADMPTQTITARVKAVERSDSPWCVLHVQSPPAHRLRFLAGQHVHLTPVGADGEGVAESHPVASCPCDDRHLEFHLPAASALAQAVEGDSIRLQGPLGGEVLKAGVTGPLVFVAWDNGFAPVKSLIEHALALDMAESIRLYWIQTVSMPGSLENRCRAWDDALDNFHYQPWPLSAVQLQVLAADRVAVATQLLGQVLAEQEDPAAVELYLAAPDWVTSLTKAGRPAQGLPATGLTLNTVPG